MVHILCQVFGHRRSVAGAYLVDSGEWHSHCKRCGAHLVRVRRSHWQEVPAQCRTSWRSDDGHAESDQHSFDFGGASQQRTVEVATERDFVTADAHRDEDLQEHRIVGEQNGNEFELHRLMSGKIARSAAADERYVNITVRYCIEDRRLRRRRDVIALNGKAADIAHFAARGQCLRGAHALAIDAEQLDAGFEITRAGVAEPREFVEWPLTHERQISER